MRRRRRRLIRGHLRDGHRGRYRGRANFAGGLRLWRVVRRFIHATRWRHLHEGRGRRRGPRGQGRAGDPGGRPAEPGRRRGPRGRHGRRLRRVVGGRLRISRGGDHRGHDFGRAPRARRGLEPGARCFLPARRPRHRFARVVAGHPLRVARSSGGARAVRGGIRAHGRSPTGLHRHAGRSLRGLRAGVPLAVGRRGRARRLEALPRLRLLRVPDGVRLHAVVAVLHGLRVRARAAHRRGGDDGPRHDDHRRPRGRPGVGRRPGVDGRRRGRDVVPPRPHSGHRRRRRGRVQGRGALRHGGRDDGDAGVRGLHPVDEQLWPHRRQRGRHRGDVAAAGARPRRDGRAGRGGQRDESRHEGLLDRLRRVGVLPLVRSLHGRVLALLRHEL
mmetsp:Transcript_1006/g.2739  ORF Transcript_1006/g.2739 Transcript_1006/m.2739 type:complete len:387 (+) Transcript_1006:860-2020(+)